MRARLDDGLRRQRRATMALLSQLDDPAWELPCLDPWSVRDVVAHLVTIDVAAVTGRLVPLLRRASSREDVERWNDLAVARLGESSPARLLAELERAGERLASLTARLPRLAWRLRVRTVFGRHRLGLLPARRVLDEWVHMVDVARSTGRGAPDPMPCPGILATGALDALPGLALPRLAIPAGVVRLVVFVTDDPEGGPFEPRRTWGVDFARRQYGPRVTATPDATVRLHAGALALLTEGRDPQGYGPIDVEGDGELARRLLDGLNPAAGGLARPRL